METKKLVLEYKVTVNLDVDEKTSEFELGEFSGVVKSEADKLVSELAEKYEHDLKGSVIEMKRVL